MRSDASGTQADRLDAALVNQTVPPGSMRYHSLLYAPADKRDFLVALHLLEDELATTGRSEHHDVAHTRLKWWHDELERLAGGTPAHPATRVLVAARSLPGVEIRKLTGLVEAAAIDLARVTFADDSELASYFDRTGAVLADLASRWLLAPALPTGPTSKAVSTLGSLIRQGDALANLRASAMAGRIHVPLATLDKLGIDVGDLGKQPWAPAVQSLVSSMTATLQTEFIRAMAAIDPADRPGLRPLLVAAGLNARLLEKRGTRNPASELGPFDKLLTAWRAARAAR